jgi:hypothetical protein
MELSKNSQPVVQMRYYILNAIFAFSIDETKRRDFANACVSLFLNKNSVGRVDTSEGDEDVICRVSVERLLEELLVEVVTDETDGSTQYEETVQTIWHKR